MKVENIQKDKNGIVSCTISGVVLKGSLDFINSILKMNNISPIVFKPQHYSETTGRWIPITSMAGKHIENYLKSERDIDDYFIEKLKTNFDNFRDYLRQLITIYDNYNKK